MTLPPVVAAPLYLIFAALAAKGAISAVRNGHITWGSFMPVAVSRRRNAGAFWFSVGVLVFVAFACASLAVSTAQDIVAGL